MFKDRLVRLQVANLHGDSVGIPAAVESGFAEIGTEAVAAKGAIRDRPETKPAALQLPEHSNGATIRHLAAIGPRDIDSIEECCSGLAVRRPAGLGQRLAGGRPVIGLHEIGRFRSPDRLFDGGPRRAREFIGAKTLHAPHCEKLVGACGSHLAEGRGRRRRLRMPQGVTDIKKDGT